MHCSTLSIILLVTSDKSVKAVGSGVVEQCKTYTKMLVASLPTTPRRPDYCYPYPVMMEACSIVDTVVLLLHARLFV